MRFTAPRRCRQWSWGLRGLSVRKRSNRFASARARLSPSMLVCHAVSAKATECDVNSTIVGSPVRGLRSIDIDETATIVWIFEQHADGMSPVRIADELNERGVTGPRGRPRQGTAIRGHRNRGSGILNNQAYIGLTVTTAKRSDTERNLLDRARPRGVGCRATIWILPKSVSAMKMPGEPGC